MADLLNMLLPSLSFCEGAEGGLAQQPLNVVSNGAYLVAAVALARLHTQGAKRLHVWLLVGSCAMVGLGSGYWHMTMTHFGLMVDIASIAVFASIAMALTARRYLGVTKPRRLAVVSAVVVAASVFASEVDYHNMLQHSAAFLPPLIIAVGMGLKLRGRHEHASGYFLMAGAFLAVGICMRIFDMLLCEFISVGTHFLWHILTACTIYCVAAGALVPDR